jgi:hypothetical protein
MLDAYIIEQIRRERAAEELRRSTLIPLRIERPPMSDEEPLPPPVIREDRPGRGSTDIDYTL